MSQVTFTRETNFTGRNGYFKCSGIDLLGISRNELMLSPLTSRGAIGRCDISIPIEDIPALIAELQKIGGIPSIEDRLRDAATDMHNHIDYECDDDVPCSICRLAAGIEPEPEPKNTSNDFYRLTISSDAYGTEIFDYESLAEAEAGQDRIEDRSNDGIERTFSIQRIKAWRGRDEAYFASIA